MGSLPPGFRFYPTEEELVGFYLRNMLENKRGDMERLIPVVDVYKYEPPELPQKSGEASVGDSENWFFFCPRQTKEAQGGRPSRTTRSGYWKATGSPTPVIHDNRVIGIRKTMVFYEGRAPTGRKTAWKMNEYSDPQASTSTSRSPQLRSEFSLCRVYKKSGGCPRSFDRRPVLAAAGENAGDMHWSLRMASGASSSHGNPAGAAADREPSQGSSASDEGQDPGGDWQMLEELDWESIIGSDGI